MTSGRDIAVDARYALGKQTLAKYFASGCRRRLALDLHADNRSRRDAGGPQRDTRGPTAALAAEQGRVVEAAAYRDLVDAFPGLVEHGPRAAKGDDSVFAAVALGSRIDAMGARRFLLESSFPVTRPFVEAMGHAWIGTDADVARADVGGTEVAFSALRPDVLWFVPADGAPRVAVGPGGAPETLDAADPRTGLRIVDVKAAAEGKAPQFSELAYYAAALAAWLADTGRGDRFAVLADAAIWTGRHEASALRRIAEADAAAGSASPLPRRLAALAADLDTLPAEVVLGAMSTFFRRDLPATLRAGWDGGDWHVDAACRGCDYLGADWEAVVAKADDGTAEGRRRAEMAGRACWPSAERAGHLSRVAGLTRGACGTLAAARVRDVAGLAAMSPGNPVFEEHQRLRAMRTVIAARTRTMAEGAPAAIAERAGTSATMPRRSDISVEVVVEYDASSGLCFAFGYRMYAWQPYDWDASAEPWLRARSARQRIGVVVDLVEGRDVAIEGATLLAFLGKLTEDLSLATAAIEGFHRAHGDDARGATVQFHLWDERSVEQMRRVFGRHLPALLARVEGMHPCRNLVWLFPAEPLLPDADQSCSDTPITVVGEVVSSLLAADVPHHYSLFGVANAYHPAWRVAPDAEGKVREGPLFRTSRFFTDPLSDRLPSDRGLEIWAGRSAFPGTSPQDYREEVRRHVARRLDALECVAERLREDLGDALVSRAPSVRRLVGSKDPEGGMARDLEVLYEHARLEAGCRRLEVEAAMAMPPHRREAGFGSLRVERVLAGDERAATLAFAGIEDGPRIMAMAVCRRSRDAKAKRGARMSLMPEAALPLKDRPARHARKDDPDLALFFDDGRQDRSRTRVRQASEVEVLDLDRQSLRLVVRCRDGFIPLMARIGLYDFALSPRACAILDPLESDVFVGPRLLPALKAVGNPPLAASRPLFPEETLTRIRPSRPRPSPPVPAERFLWDADALAGEASATAGWDVAGRLEATGERTTPRQRDAVAAAASRRLTLLWGPPGTGKTTTAVAFLKGIVAEAAAHGARLRIAVVGPTWMAIDTVARRLPEALEGTGARIVRLPDGARPPPEELADRVAALSDPEAAARLAADLDAPTGVTVVAGTVGQLVKIRPTGTRKGSARPIFDLMLIDEASQLSVAQAVVAFTTLAEGASLVVVGDDLQMPPISRIDPPSGVEHMVGSIYDFYRRYRRGEPGAAGIEPIMLDVSFRSNAEIVGFVRTAGYGPDLTSHHADLAMATAGPLPVAEPRDWPMGLPWSGGYARILDPASPLVAIVRDDALSSQSSRPEAKLVAALVACLSGRLLDRAGGSVLRGVDLFDRGIGIVTPHKAQQAAILEEFTLLGLEGRERAAAAACVDTVERFQGQERTVMIASFAVGDVDTIAGEEEFLYSLNRFNVIASRARAKFVAIMSRTLVERMPEDPGSLRSSRLLKSFAGGHLPHAETLDLPGIGRIEMRTRTGA